MLKPEEMSKIIIACPDTYMGKVINTLHKLNILHIVEHKKTPDADIGTPFKTAEKLSQMIVTIRAIADYLNIDLKKELKSVREISLKEINTEVAQINTSIRNIQDKLKLIEDALKQKQQLLPELNHLSKINIPFESFIEYKSLASFVGYITKPKGFIEDLVKITTKFEFIRSEEESKITFALFIDKSFSGSVSNLLQRRGFVSMDTSKFKGEKLSPTQLLDKVNSEINKLNEEKNKLIKKLNEIKSKCENYLILSERFLNTELEKAQAPLKFAKTSNSFLITGWLPKIDLEKAIEKLNKITKENIYIESLPIDEHEHVPIKLKNPKLIKPFEFFMNLYSLPSYKELDPTFFVFITFPIFFGFMLGDMGYGLVTLIAFMLLKNKLTKFADFFNILILASVSTIIFGAIFGEFFGAEEILGFHIPRLISRNPEHHLEPLMIAAVFFGIIHVNAGLTIGFANELKEHGFVKALLAKGGWIVLELGVLILALTFFKVWSVASIVGYIIGVAVSLLAMAMITKGEGIRGLVEIPSIFGNILSYLRLMAIGLSSVGLAIVINDLAKKLFSASPIMAIFGVVVLVIGHILNIAIGMLGSFLHALRLHYVEFFTKFYKGGGVSYLPFGERAKT